jgi:hypothetical protein
LGEAFIIEPWLVAEPWLIIEPACMGDGFGEGVAAMSEIASNAREYFMIPPAVSALAEASTPGRRDRMTGDFGNPSARSRRS